MRGARARLTPPCVRVPVFRYYSSEFGQWSPPGEKTSPCLPLVPLFVVFLVQVRD